MNARHCQGLAVNDDDVIVTGVVVKARAAVVEKSALLLERYREAAKKRREALQQQAAVPSNVAVAPEVVGMNRTEIIVKAAQAACVDNYNRLLQRLHPLSGCKRSAEASSDDAGCPTKRTANYLNESTVMAGGSPQSATKKEPAKKAPAKLKPVRRLTQKEQNKATVDGIFEFLFGDSTTGQEFVVKECKLEPDFIQQLLEANKQCTIERKALVKIHSSSTRPKHGMNVDGCCRNGERGMSGAGVDADYPDWRVYLFSGPNNFYVYYDEWAGELIIMRNWEGAGEMKSGYCIKLFGEWYAGGKDGWTKY